MSPIQLTVVETEGDPRSPSALIMRDENGQEYRVALTNGAARAPRSDQAPAQLAMAVTTLSVRDIQAALRAGRTRNDLADEFGVDPERVARFEGPILAERAFVAQKARGVRLRRTDGPTDLESVVAARLTERGDDAGSLEWDAWRREDGRWTVTATWVTLGSDVGDETWASAEWIFDQVGLTIVPADDSATQLMAPAPSAPATPPPAAPPAGGDPYSSSPTDDLTAIARAVREETPAEPAAPEAPARGGWTPVVVTGGRADAPAPSPVTTAQPDVPAALRDDHERDTDAIADDTSEHDTTTHPAVTSATTSESPDDVVDWTDDHFDGVDEPVADDVIADITDTQPVTTFISGERSRPSASKRRSVPSWDEILFGSSPTTRDPD